MEETLSYARIKPVVNQVELHPLLAQRKLVGVCLRNVRSRCCRCCVGAFLWSPRVLPLVGVCLRKVRLRESAGAAVKSHRQQAAAAAAAAAPGSVGAAAASAALLALPTVHPLPAAVCLLQGVHSVAYSPLGHTGPDSDVMAAAAEVAAEVGKTPAQVGPGGSRDWGRD